MHHQQHKFIYFLRKPLNEIYLTHAIRSFAAAMITIFIPIFLLQQGYALLQVALFYIIDSIIVFFIVRKVVGFAAKRGVRRSITISTPLTILFYVALYSLSAIIGAIGALPALAVVAVLHTVSMMFYFMGFHIDFAKMHEQKNAAKQVSVLNVATIIASIIAPLLGASIIVWWSFNTLFIIIMAIIAASVIPLFFSKDMHEEQETKLEGIYTKKAFRQFFPYIGEGFRNYAAGVFWPVLLFLLAIDLQEMGGIFTFANVLLAILTVYLGKKVHEGNQQKVLRIGSWVHSTTLVARTVVKTVATIALVQGLAAVTYGFVSLPYSTIHYNKSQRQGAAHMTYAREIYLWMGRFLATIMLVVFLVAGVSGTLSLTMIIMLGGFATVLMGELREKSLPA